jgi:predicted nucleotidyltransferase
MMGLNDPNRLILSRVARALGDLRESLVFVGGCSTGVLVTTIRAQTIRPTDDVDMVVQATTAHEYHVVEALLSERGFAHDMSADAPICRWHYEGIAVDLMPSEKSVLGFANRWYPLAISSAQWVMLEDDLAIRLIAAPVFIATKFEAFHDRGKSDFLMSHDLEDIITVIDGRVSLIEEVKQAPDDLREALALNFRKLLAEDDFLDALSGHLPGDVASQARLTGLIKKLRDLAAIE